MAALAIRNPVTVMTNADMPADIPALESHVYAALSISNDADPIWTLYNPWGVDGAGTDSDPYDGTVKIPLSKMKLGFYGATMTTGALFHFDPMPAADPTPVLIPMSAHEAVAAFAAAVTATADRSDASIAAIAQDIRNLKGTP